MNQKYAGLSFIKGYFSSHNSYSSPSFITFDTSMIHLFWNQYYDAIKNFFLDQKLSRHEAIYNDFNQSYD